MPIVLSTLGDHTVVSEFVVRAGVVIDGIDKELDFFVVKKCAYLYRAEF